MRRSRRLFLVLAAAVTSAGCSAPDIYRATEGGYVGAKITPKRTWVVRGDLSDLPAAADGTLITLARSGRTYTGAELIIDLQQTCMFQSVIIDHGVEDQGYCRKVSVATSLDGKLWVERHAAPGTRRVTILSLPEVVLAQHIRLRAVEPGARPWAVAEVFLQ